jgi:hypothetical protein
MSHRKTDLGIPCPSKSAKVVLGRVLINLLSVSAACQSLLRSESDQSATLETERAYAARVGGSARYRGACAAASHRLCQGRLLRSPNRSRTLANCSAAKGSRN